MGAVTKDRMGEIVSFDPDLMPELPVSVGPAFPCVCCSTISRAVTLWRSSSPGCPTVTREQVERYLELVQGLVTECTGS